jgi:hypothetical protein
MASKRARVADVRAEVCRSVATLDAPDVALISPPPPWPPALSPVVTAPVVPSISQSPAWPWTEKPAG